MPNYENQVKQEFSIFDNKYKANDKHPQRTGKIEFDRTFLKALAEQARTGTMPVVKVASWDRVSRDTGTHYQFMRLEFTPEDTVSEPAPEPAPAPAVKKEDDDFPF
tara:strand:- start:321 stop:638 length:318 start_codon:yes stop_codon:yes gene_type:complete